MNGGSEMHHGVVQSVGPPISHHQHHQPQQHQQGQQHQQHQQGQQGQQHQQGHQHQQRPMKSSSNQISNNANHANNKSYANKLKNKSGGNGNKHPPDKLPHSLKQPPIASASVGGSSGKGTKFTVQKISQSFPM